MRSDSNQPNVVPRREGRLASSSRDSAYRARILFVCHGNICRSPMAEFAMKDLVAKAGRADEFEIASAATSAEELGNPVYPPARRKLSEHGISCAGKTARRLRPDDFERWDMLIGMDDWNRRNMMRVCPKGREDKVSLLLDYTDDPRDLVDPWYTNDFDAAWNDVLAGFEGLLNYLTQKE
ncbi:MAG: low molecular weight phosphotyrosine protein phosphatase [Thermoguttaceae bacterium]|nr:low molecular weight phosphotyrosine protein phosphatase [Thermoguttaceae bacterium]